ncbi:MAG: NfeD family protein [Gemmatimonadetes bacterium]|nr:MAG: NfeD family protein [Gemmatimonadota bacterium]
MSGVPSRRDRPSARRSRCANFSAMHEWQVWFIAALLLFVAEMIAPGFWLLSVAVGSLAAGLVSLVLPGVVAPALAFAAGTLLSLVGVRPFLLRVLHRAGRDIRTNVDALAGKVGIVSARIDPTTGKGRVLVEGEDWRAASLMDAPLEPGTRVMVVRVEGTTLYVDKET